MLRHAARRIIFLVCIVDERRFEIRNSFLEIFVLRRKPSFLHVCNAELAGFIREQQKKCDKTYGYRRM